MTITETLTDLLATVDHFANSRPHMVSAWGFNARVLAVKRRQGSLLLPPQEFIQATAPTRLPGSVRRWLGYRWK